jgi:hypothetical protein
MSSSQTVTLDPITGQANPLRPVKGVTATFTADANGPIIDKRGFGLVGVSWPALAGRTLTWKVGITSALLRDHSSASINLATAGATSLSDLAEWPFIQPIIGGGAITDSLVLALS